MAKIRKVSDKYTKGKTTTTGDADLFAEAKKILSKKGKTFNF